jgi:hypothetical protein
MEPASLDMQSQSRLFTLPRELRDMIYEYCVTTTEGYWYNYETGTLVAIDWKPVDIALTYTCRLAAIELWGLALTLNTLYFTTTYGSSLRERAGIYAARLKLINGYKSDVLKAAHALIDASTTSQNYPEFLRVTQAFQTHQATDWLMDNHCGETPSLYRKFLDAALDAVSQHPDFSQTIARDPLQGWLSDRLPELLATEVNP